MPVSDSAATLHVGHRSMPLLGRHNLRNASVLNSIASVPGRAKTRTSSSESTVRTKTSKLPPPIPSTVRTKTSKPPPIPSADPAASTSEVRTASSPTAKWPMSVGAVSPAADASIAVSEIDNSYAHAIGLKKT